MTAKTLIQYPPIGDTIERFIAKGGDGDLVTRATLKTSAAIGSPALEAGTLGTLPQVTVLRANGVEWKFANHLPFQLLYFLDTDLDGVATIVSQSHWTSITEHGTQSSSLFERTYSSAAGDAVRVKVEAKTDSRGMGYFEWTIVSVSLSTSNWTLAGFDLPYLRLRPAGSHKRLAGMSPYLPGSGNAAAALPWVGGPMIAWYPGDGRAATINTVANSYPGEGGALNQQPASMQFMHTWNMDSQVGLCVMACDGEGYRKAFRQHGDGFHAEMAVRHVPPNARVRTTMGASPYTVRVYPMRGDYQEACELYRAVMVEDVEPTWLAGVRTLEETQQRASVEGWGVGSLGQGGCMANAYMLMTANVDPDGTEAAAVTAIQDAWNDLKAYLGWAPETALFYEASSIPFGTLEQDQWTDRGEDLFTWVKNTFGATYPLRYTHANLWSEPSTWYTTQDSSDPALGWTTALTDPSNFVPVDADGASPEGTSKAGDPNGARLGVQFAQANARAHVIDVLNRRFVAGDAGNGIAATPQLKGFYLDAFTAVQDGYDDYRSAVFPDAEDRGMGSPAYWDGAQRLCKELRSTFRASKGNDFNFISEWPSENPGMLLDGLSVACSPKVAQLASVPLSIGSFNRVWAPYVGRSDFDGSLFALGTAGSTSHVEENSLFGLLDRWGLQVGIAQGVVLHIVPWFKGRPPIIQDSEGDDGYSIWTAHRGRTMAMLKAWYTHLRAWGMRAYWNGRQLRWLPGSAMHNLARNDFDLNGAVLEGVEWFASMWALERVNKVRLVLTTGEATAQTISFDVDRGRYPDLPKGRIRVDELLSNGTRTSGFATFTDVWQATDIVIPADGMRIFEFQRDVF